MEVTTVYKIIIGIVLLAFWGYGSGKLTENPSLAVYIIPFSYAVLTVIAIVIQLELKKNIQDKMRKVLNSEIKERKDELLRELRGLVSYLEKAKIPNYSESGVEGLEDDFKEFDSIKSKYTFQPKIIHATLLTVLSSLILVLFLLIPSLWVFTTADGYNFTLAHVGLAFFGIALWMILDILVTSLEVRIWEKEEKPTRQKTENK